jgi:hypothetical protein
MSTSSVTHAAGLGISAVRSMTRGWPEVTLRDATRMRRRGSAGQCLVTAVACVDLYLKLSKLIESCKIEDVHACAA